MSDPHEDPERRERRRTFARLIVASFFQNLALQCFFHLPAYLEQRGAGEFAIGTIMAILHQK